MRRVVDAVDLVVLVNVETDLSRNGWADRTKAIVIDPELEVWVWGDLVQTSGILGWGQDVANLRRHLSSRGLWEPCDRKPSDPKGAMRTAMECAAPGRRRKRSARIFHEIADSAAVDHCQDPAFKRTQAYPPGVVSTDRGNMIGRPSPPDGAGRPGPRTSAIGCVATSPGCGRTRCPPPAAALARTHFSADAILRGALFSIWHNLSGSLVAVWCARRRH